MRHRISFPRLSLQQPWIIVLAKPVDPTIFSSLREWYKAGYNNLFDEAVYRLAQIVQDSKAPGIPVLFSWPSKGLLGVPAYQDDYQSADDVRAALAQFLRVSLTRRPIRQAP
jgi:Alpha/beta hydrolase of unknown function (DUF900)